MVYLREALILLVVCIGGLGQTFPPATCRYWCVTAAFPPAYYCCSTGSEKPGTCPVISTCPAFSQVQVILCTSDSACAGAEKCCFNHCYNTHICSTPSRPPR